MYFSYDIKFQSIKMHPLNCLWISDLYLHNHSLNGQNEQNEISWKQGKIELCTHLSDFLNNLIKKEVNC